MVSGILCAVVHMTHADWVARGRPRFDNNANGYCITDLPDGEAIFDDVSEYTSHWLRFQGHETHPEAGGAL
jgi:hypothetical protein